jgi:hypothetical protein
VVSQVGVDCGLLIVSTIWVIDILAIVIILIAKSIIGDSK